MRSASPDSRASTSAGGSLVRRATSSRRSPRSSRSRSRCRPKAATASGSGFTTPASPQRLAGAAAVVGQRPLGPQAQALVQGLARLVGVAGPEVRQPELVPGVGGALAGAGVLGELLEGLAGLPVGEPQPAQLPVALAEAGGLVQAGAELGQPLVLLAHPPQGLALVAARHPGFLVEHVLQRRLELPERLLQPAVPGQ